MVGPEVKAALHKRNFEAVSMDETLITVVNCHDRCKKEESKWIDDFLDNVRWCGWRPWTRSSSISRILSAFLNGDSFKENGNDTLHSPPCFEVIERIVISLSLFPSTCPGTAKRVCFYAFHDSQKS